MGTSKVQALEANGLQSRGRLSTIFDRRFNVFIRGEGRQYVARRLLRSCLPIKRQFRGQSRQSGCYVLQTSQSTHHLSRGLKLERLLSARRRYSEWSSSYMSKCSGLGFSEGFLDLARRLYGGIGLGQRMVCTSLYCPNKQFHVAFGVQRMFELSVSRKLSASLLLAFSLLAERSGTFNPQRCILDRCISVGLQFLLLLLLLQSTVHTTSRDTQHAE